MNAPSSCDGSAATVEKASRSQGMTPMGSSPGIGPVPPTPPCGRNAGYVASTPKAFRSGARPGRLAVGAKAAAGAARSAIASFAISTCVVRR